jgi:hypothetical protein
MLELVIAVGVIFLFARQFYGRRAEAWTRRGRAAQPVLRHVGKDARAVLYMPREAWVMRRESRAFKVPDTIPVDLT